jgi:biotin transport system substrate-specific component
MFGDHRRSLILSQTAAFIGLIVVGSWVSIPFFPVPLTLQTLFVLLSGAVMKRYAVLPTGLYVLFGAMNLPVFHNGTAGIGILLGPTGGYMLGFIPAAFIAGIAYERAGRSRHAAGFALGTGIIYAIGMVWLSVSAGLPLIDAFIVGVIPFIPGDVLKAYAAYFVAERYISPEKGDI